MTHIMRRGLLIVFTGPVGVGKSTIIRNLMIFYRKSGIKTLPIYVKAFHGISYLIWKLTFKILFRKSFIARRMAPWYLIGKAYPYVSVILVRLSLFLDVTLELPLRIIIINILRKFGFNIFSEEFLHSALLDYMFTFRHIEKSRMIKMFLDMLLRYIKKCQPDIVVYLYADIKELKRRWHHRGYGDPQLEYVLYQIAFHESLSTLIQNSHIIRINTNSLNVTNTLTNILKIMIFGYGGTK